MENPKERLKKLFDCPFHVIIVFIRHAEFISASHHIEHKHLYVTLKQAHLPDGQVWVDVRNVYDILRIFRKNYNLF